MGKLGMSAERWFAKASRMSQIWPDASLTKQNYRLGRLVLRQAIPGRSTKTEGIKRNINARLTCLVNMVNMVNA
jgi:hypothetical protein